MGIDYNLIQTRIDEYSKYILMCIKKDYATSLSPEQIENIENLSNEERFIIINSPNESDLEFFSKQEGINDKENYSYNYVPAGHGGRTKEDNKIHIYPYSTSFQKCESNDEIIKKCVNDIVIHEIFHYFIRPNGNEEFGNFLTEGLVQYYTEEFAKRNRLGNPKSNYDKNVDAAKLLIEGFPDNLDKDKCVFNLDQDSMLKISSNGERIYDEFITDKNYHEQITNFIINCCNQKKINLDDPYIQKFIKHFEKENNKETITQELEKNITYMFKNNETQMKMLLENLYSLENKENINKKEI